MALIQFKNVNLEYPIREHRAVTLKEFILRGLLFKREERIRTIRALSDLTFDVHDNERIGVVGLNGAGKSSLLKTIAGVYPVQSGMRHVEGSICSLFDINLGFEPDATGWQNIYYRSYLPTSIKDKLQEIGDFTELGHFLDLPLRCYSAGMVMRLAFAIATARRPEILLIDEVLATGDLPFQKKAYERMSHFLHQARIVVVVSHNLDFLQAFCSRAIWLHQGKVHSLGPVRSVIQAFQDESGQLSRVA
jgi:ABC-type polysaccharide/polyol phosphate transport system ATPase subunit